MNLQSEIGKICDRLAKVSWAQSRGDSSEKYYPVKAAQELTALFKKAMEEAIGEDEYCNESMQRAEEGLSEDTCFMERNQLRKDIRANLERIMK